MGMMHELAVSPSCPPSDEVHFHIAQLFVTTLDDSDQGMQVDKRDTPHSVEGNWGRNDLQLIETHTESGHPVIPVKDDLRAG